MFLILNDCCLIPCLLVRFSPITGRISQYQLPQLFVGGTVRGGFCFAMVFLLFDRFPMPIYALDILLAVHPLLPSF